MKGFDEIQDVHDRLNRLLILDDEERILAPITRSHAQHSLDVICWLMDHGNQVYFQEFIDHLNIAMTARGYTFGVNPNNKTMFQ